jgi:hypothetical protein
MTREWKPGDVAISTHGPNGNAVIYRVEDGWRCAAWGDDQFHKRLDIEPRPLVVIDPEDREQVERLHLAYATTAKANRVDAMQAALREFADPKPPKPEEPCGWGAVVEASDGWYWTLIAPDSKKWANYGAGGYRTYDEIDVVRIVGEGVTP